MHLGGTIYEGFIYKFILSIIQRPSFMEFSKYLLINTLYRYL